MKTIILLLIFYNSILAIDSTKYYYVINLLNDKKWEMANQQIEQLKNPDDPEYYIMVFNYHFLKAKNSAISIQQGKSTKEEAINIYKDENLSEQVGYMEESTSYDMEEINKGIELFKPALTKFKNRLDLHFGLVYLSSECKLYDELTDRLIRILDISKEIDNRWIWSFNEQLKEDPKEFMLENIQSYINGLFNLGLSSVDSMIIKVSEAMILNYPELIYGYNNVGSILSIQGNNEKALEYFQKANEIDAQDLLVLANMAEIYTKLNKKELAIEKLNKIIELGDDQTKDWAKEKLQKLN